MGLVDSELRIIVGLSGGGSTMQAVYDATQGETEYGHLPKTKIVGVFSPNPEAGGLVKAQKFQTLDHKRDVYPIDKAVDHTTLHQRLYGERMIDFFKSHQDFDIFCQYGLTDFTPENVIAWLAENGKIGINQHGACVDQSVAETGLAYDFGGYGMSCPERFHAAHLMFVRETRRNYWQDPVAQYLDPKFDGGGVLQRGRVEIEPTDTVNSLKQRVIQEEWRVQIATLKDFEDGVVNVKPGYDDLVSVDERPLLDITKKVARKLYGIEGEVIRAPRLDNISVKGNLVPESYAQSLANLLDPNL